MSYNVPHFINGKALVTSGPKLELINPANEEIIGHVALGDKGIVDEAVLAAQKAFLTWSQTSILKRTKILFNYKTILEKNIDALAQLVTREHGKTLADARGSVQRGIDVVEFACGMASHLQGSYTEAAATEIDTYSVRQPLGVCAGITPFNFPAMIALWMFPIAIGCGNTFILKPSEKDPSCSVKLAELAIEAGLPPGVLNVVQGDKEAVNAILNHPGIQSVSFVGSSPVAKYVYQTATQNGKRAQAFGSAKNHCVVMPDADLDNTVDAIVGAAYGSAGERCMAISVVVAVGNKIADLLVARMESRIKNLIIGVGTNAGIEMGPLINKAHLKRVKEYVDLGVEEGATLVVDGREHHPKGVSKGYFMGGCLFDNVKPEMRIYQEEIFGPVLSIVRVANFDEALDLINNHVYGNGTAIFTRDGNAARTFANRVQIGMVGINIPIPVPIGSYSFGGWKHSVFGDLHMHGPEAILFYTKLKTITQRWVKSAIDIEFAMPTH